MLYRKDDKTREVKILPSTLEKEEYRSDFRRDYGRLVHSPCFRRLQGKTQLFPAWESDFFRNRLTHSLEVAQIAKSIALRINARYRLPNGRRFKIDTDLVEFAGLAHDVGHPPFGHIGEKALNQCMKGHGGFEGNAQTLRLLARIEKRRKLVNDNSGIDDDGKDKRLGLNLTYRTLASILKNDRKIPRRSSDNVVKGYYYTEAELVKKIKDAVAGDYRPPGGFKTIECTIMDVADDIAYSTFDLEDAFKAGLFSPLSLLAAPDEIVEAVAKECTKHLRKTTEEEVRNVLVDTYSEFIVPGLGISAEEYEEIVGGDPEEVTVEQYNEIMKEFALGTASDVFRASKGIARTSYQRTKISSRLVGTFIRGVEVKVNEKVPALSRAYLRVDYEKRVEVLKRFTYVSLIGSPEFKIVEFRGGAIVRDLFETLTGPEGSKLLPRDFRRIHDRLTNKAGKRRVICDFIAGMTDRYAQEFYAKIKSPDRARSIFRPH